MVRFHIPIMLCSRCNRAIKGSRRPCPSSFSLQESGKLLDDGGEEELGVRKETDALVRAGPHQQSSQLAQKGPAIGSLWNMSLIATAPPHPRLPSNGMLLSYYHLHLHPMWSLQGPGLYKWIPNYEEPLRKLSAHTQTYGSTSHTPDMTVIQTLNFEPSTSRLEAPW